MQHRKAIHMPILSITPPSVIHIHIMARSTLADHKGL
jgi:hypothetical protein